MVGDKKISSRSAKELILACIDGMTDPEIMAKERKLFHENDSNLISKAVNDILSSNASVVADFKAGKEAALEYLVGQGMKALRGATDPIELREVFRKELQK